MRIFRTRNRRMTRVRCEFKTKIFSKVRYRLQEEKKTEKSND